MADVFSEFSLPVGAWTEVATNVTSIAIQLCDLIFYIAAGSTTTTACNLRARNISMTTAQSGTIRWRLWGKIA